MRFLREDDGERTPNVGAGLVKRGLIAMLLVVAMTGTALATTVVLEVDDVASTFLGQGREQVDIPEITKADAGGARTILLLGSDARYDDKKLGLKPRSDTMLLVRADPDRDAIAVMSIPRDLAVEIPGHGRDKINSAFENGGERLTVRTIKKLFEDATGDNVPDQQRDQRRVRLLPARRELHRRRLRRHRPRLLQRQLRRRRALRGDRRRRGLPEAQGPGRARLRALPAHGQRLHPRGAPAGLPAPGAQPVGRSRSSSRSASASSSRAPSAATSRSTRASAPTRRSSR